MTALVTLTAELDPDQALALAQFLKRSSFSDFRSNAVNDDEAYLMIYAANRLRDALSDQGYSPR